MSILASIIAAAIVVPKVDLLTVGLVANPLHPEPVAEQIVTAKVDILIKPNGSPMRCEFVAGSGSQEAAKRACSDFRAHRYPPRPSFDGRASYALLRITVVQVSGREPAPHFRATPDAVLWVNHLPDGLTEQAVELVLAIDATGSVASCLPESDSKRPQLARAICAAPQFLELPKARDGGGNPVPYVTRRQVTLVAAASN